MKTQKLIKFVDDRTRERKRKYNGRESSFKMISSGCKYRYNSTR